MHLDISPQTNARLAAKAQEHGLSVETFLERLLVLERFLGEAGAVAENAASGKGPELPVWDLGVRDEMHRRDIYDDR